MGRLLKPALLPLSTLTKHKGRKAAVTITIDSEGNELFTRVLLDRGHL